MWYSGQLVGLLGITVVSCTHQCYVKNPHTQHPTLCVLEVERRAALDLGSGVHSLLSSHYWRETPTTGGRGGEGQNRLQVKEYLRVHYKWNEVVAIATNFSEAVFTALSHYIFQWVSRLHLGRLHCVCALSRLFLVVVRSRPCSETRQGLYNTSHPNRSKEVNVKPYEVHTNSNVGTHNIAIAIGGTLGWSKQQQYCQFSPDAERQMQGKERRNLSVYFLVANWLRTSADSLPKMLWRTWSLLPQSYRIKSVTCSFPEMPFKADTPNSTLSESDN